MARDGQYRHIVGLRAVIATIEARLAAPTDDTLTVTERKARRKTKTVKGYPTQAERFQKQRRVQHLRAEVARTERDRAAGRIHVVEGGKRLAHTRQHLAAAGLTEPRWRQQWAAARWRITANGSPDEPFGNLTITLTPAGVISVRLPKPLEHLANAHAGATSSPVRRCSATAPRNGQPGSPAQTRCPTPSPVNHTGVVCI